MDCHVFSPVIKFTNMNFTYRNIVIVAFLVACIHGPAVSQQITRSALVTSGGIGNTLEYTIGEPFSSTMITGNYMLTLGMQQMDQSLTLSVNELSGNIINLVAFPNPSDGNFNVRVNSETVVDASLTIVDGFGKVVRQKKLNLIPGISELYITIDEATPGVYFLFLYSDTHSYQMKVVVL